MKTILFKFSIIAGFMLLTNVASAQTAGTLSFSFSQTPHSSYSGNRNVMAIWIQSNSGQFVLTRSKNAGFGTADHLQTWAVNSGGPQFNCMSASCNTVSATTGATFTSFSNRSITWDGTDVSGNIVPDGPYKVTIESTWNHGSSGGTIRSFTFTKGPNADIQTPTSDANFSGISLSWNPSSTGLEENNISGVNIYPNPSLDGIFTIDYTSAESIKVYDVSGTLTKDVQLDDENGTQMIDLSEFNNGVYFVRVKTGTITSEHKIILNK